MGNNGEGGRRRETVEEDAGKESKRGEFIYRTGEREASAQVQEKWASYAAWVGDKEGGRGTGLKNCPYQVGPPPDLQTDRPTGLA